MNILIIQNDPPETLGLYEEYIKTHEPYRLIHAYKMSEEDEFPPIDQYTHFIIGPTPISANKILEYNFLTKEWAYLQEIIESNKPCLGVCCGGQMLAKKMGGSVLKSPGKEIGGYNVTLTEHGISDPLFKGFPREFPVFHWHSDMFTIPPRGKLLATGNPCPIQAFRKNNVWGIIFHLEITSDDAVRWADAYPDELKDIGKTREQVIEECKKDDYDMKILSKKLMENFLNQ
jgi:GMP synthase (glutamine-hydrolysing)